MEPFTGAAVFCSSLFSVAVITLTTSSLVWKGNFILELSVHHQENPREEVKTDTQRQKL